MSNKTEKRQILYFCAEDYPQNDRRQMVTFIDSIQGQEYEIEIQKVSEIYKLLQFGMVSFDNVYAIIIDRMFSTATLDCWIRILVYAKDRNIPIIILGPNKWPNMQDVHGDFLNRARSQNIYVISGEISADKVRQLLSTLEIIS